MVVALTGFSRRKAARALSPPDGAGSMCGEVYPVGHVDGFRNVRVTSLFHREAGMMALLINWLGFVERDPARGSAGGPARVASLSLAKKEVKREARKRVRVVQENQTSLRSLVLSLVACGSNLHKTTFL